MSSAEVYGWGALLPAPTDEKYLAPLEAGRSKLVRRIYAGYGHAILAGSDHAKWVRRAPGPLCDNNTSRGYKIDEIGGDPGKLSALESAAFGQTHTLLLLRNTIARDCLSDTVPAPGSETQVLALGSGRQGQLGLGAKTLETTQPQPVRALSTYQVVQVSCGAHHSAAVTYGGDLFTWGRGIEGQLGHASHNLSPELNDAISGVQFRPKPVSAFLVTRKRSRPVATVCCGHKFTVVVTRAGEVWAFGEGALGQLGIGRVTRVTVPTLVMTACPNTGEPFVQVAAGWAHTLARTKGGDVFSWGFNALGSLGLGDNRTRFSPEAVVFGGACCRGGAGGNGDGDGTESSVAMAKVHACGNCSGALTLGGELFTWGYDAAGSLGHGHHRRRSQAGEDVHVSRPRRVSRLAGSAVTDFALSGGGGVALVPLRVKRVQPGSGPLEAGCKVVINGDAFWDSPDIVVKFSSVGKGRKPLAARSAVGTYVAWDEDGGDSGDRRNGNERVTCMAPRFASPDEVFVEVTVDGQSFSEDGKRFQYYRTPEMKAITPKRSRPPFPRLRLDGKHICPSDHMVVRFEEEAGKDSGIDAEELAPAEQNDGASSPLTLDPARVFEVPGKVESEMIKVGKDPETKLPIKKRRWFITCEAPSLGAGVKLPLAYRVTVAPNGVTSRGTPVRFFVHDPFADACSPIVVPIPVSSRTSVGGDGVGEPEVKGTVIYITGRNLYRGAGLGARLNRGLDNFVPLDAVAFDPELEAITGVVSVAAGKLLARGKASNGKENPRPPAISVAVEVTMDGEDFFAAPEGLILYRDLRLTLKGDGFFPASGGGFAELVPEASTFRGDNPKVRLLSETHGLDMTLPLLSSPPPREAEPVNEMSPGTLGGEEGQSEAQSTPVNGSEPKVFTSQEQEEAEIETAQGNSQPREDNGDDDDAMVDESRPKLNGVPPASADSFFFAVPPLPKDLGNSGEGDPPASTLSCLDGKDRRKTLSQKATTAGGRSTDAKIPKNKGAKDAHQDAAEAPESNQESNRSLSVFVSLNGRHWQPASGPPLTYFQPPPEPVKPDPVKTKRANRKNKH